MLVAHADSLKHRESGRPGMDHLTGSFPEYSPSLPQGWGRVNLDELFQDTESVVVFDQDHRDYDPRPTDARRFTTSGQYWRVNLRVDDPGEDVVIVMAYTDRYADLPTETPTVNDLHLSVFQLGLTQNSARDYYGNYFNSDPADGYSKDLTGPTSSEPLDHVNTVEVIRIKKGELLPVGFHVMVKAGAINGIAVPGLNDNSFNQDFALYVYNAKPVTAQ